MNTAWFQKPSKHDYFLFEHSVYQAEKHACQLFEIIINLRQWKHISITFSVQTSEVLGKAFKIVEKNWMLSLLVSTMMDGFKTAVQSKCVLHISKD